MHRLWGSCALTVHPLGVLFPGSGVGRQRDREEHTQYPRTGRRKCLLREQKAGEGREGAPSRTSGNDLFRRPDSGCPEPSETGSCASQESD